MSDDSPTILKEIDAFMALHHMPPSTFSRLAMGDASFIQEVKAENRSITHRTEKKIKEFMATYMENTQCPKTVRLVKPGKTTKGNRA